MIDDEWKIPNSRSLWRCSSRERRYIGLETVHGKRVKVSRGEGPVARQLALPAHSTSFQQNHVATLQFDSGVAFDSFFFVRFCVILVGPVGDVSPRLEELKNYPRSHLTPAWQRWSYNSIGTRGKCAMWGLIMYGEEEEGWLYEFRKVYLPYAFHRVTWNNVPQNWDDCTSLGKFTSFEWVLLFFSLTGLSNEVEDVIFF